MARVFRRISGSGRPGIIAAVCIALPLLAASCAKNEEAAAGDAAAATATAAADSSAISPADVSGDAPLVGETKPAAAPAFTVKLLDGTKMDPTKQRGKIVILDFWATWCGPCKMSIPSLQALHEKENKNGVLIVGLSNEEKATIVPFAREMGMTYALAVDPDAVNEAGSKYGIRGIPALVVLDKAGKVRFAEMGYDPDPTAGTEAKLEKLIAKLKAEETPSS